MNVTLKKNINWVGYVDWNIRDFHSYNTNRGATYNSYLVQDEKTALIDTVKAPYVEYLLNNISEFVDIRDIKYIVCNHAEPDHSGGLPKVIEKIPGVTLICSKKCKDVLFNHYDISNWNIEIAATGDSVSLGKRTLQFIETPMVHWPESMFTYIPEEKLLFSMDAFGQHYATSQRFDDEVSISILMQEAKTYYANIVMPYGKQVISVLREAEKLNIEMIAPSHGLIWRSHYPEIVKAYKDWAVCRPKAKVLVIYDTMWDSTGKMANAIVNGANIPGVEVKLINIRLSNLTQIATEILDAATIAFGSSTLNREMMPMAGAVLTYLKGLRPSGKSGFAFGSYGWSENGPKSVNEWLKDMKWEIVRKPIMAKYVPTAEVLKECRNAGKLLGEKALQAAGNRIN
ncbi:MAG: FprA family A-type flavoprotein [Candidatus Heimdallarchaeota archaeon]|nr:FprA family A-type flavoprotein [Candidatus Heimdallarchaeota archaeon]